MSLFSNRESSNPVLSEKRFANQEVILSAGGQTMTASGAVTKTLFLAVLMLCTAVIGYNTPSTMFLLGGAIGGLVIVVIASFKTAWSPILAPLYALAEGLFVGTVTAMYASAYDGIVFQAVSLTIGMLFIMLFLYQARIIVVTQRLRSGIIMATMAVMLLYLASWGLSFFGIQVPYLHEGGIMGIGISLLIIGIASMNLLLDFDMFEKGEQLGAPKYMEWFAAMGLLVTLVWLYIEFLRLLSKLRD
ncbi:MAG: Bax inhibitor-1/YccA family protein [Saprospiraceae bacterium]|nr:Bax inhibitor-1/YccA family protein [Saprospiraceae bacterium]